MDGVIQMSDSLQFKFKEYSVPMCGFDPDAPFEIWSPNWFQRIVLRKKPRVTSFRKIFLGAKEEMDQFLSSQMYACGHR